MEDELYCEGSVRLKNVMSGHPKYHYKAGHHPVHDAAALAAAAAAAVAEPAAAPPSDEMEVEDNQPPEEGAVVERMRQQVAMYTEQMWTLRDVLDDLVPPLLP